MQLPRPRMGVVTGGAISGNAFEGKKERGEIPRKYQKVIPKVLKIHDSLDKS